MDGVFCSKLLTLKILLSLAAYLSEYFSCGLLIYPFISETI